MQRQGTKLRLSTGLPGHADVALPAQISAGLIDRAFACAARHLAWMHDGGVTFLFG